MIFHHIGIACRDIVQTVEKLRQIHNITHQSAVVYDPQQKAYVCLLTLDGGPALELVAGPQVATLLQNRITYYHVCYVVEDLDASVAELTRSGAVVCGPSRPAALFQERRVAFLFTETG